MARTIAYSLLEDRFKMAAGLATLSQVDGFFFKQAVNNRAALAWSRIKWPELQTLVEKTNCFAYKLSVEVRSEFIVIVICCIFIG